MHRTLIAVLCLLSLTACVGLRSYRTQPPHGPVEQPPFQDKDGNDIHLAFVELDDQGLHWTDRQLPAAMEMDRGGGGAAWGDRGGVRSWVDEQRPVPR